MSSNPQPPQTKAKTKKAIAVSNIGRGYVAANAGKLLFSRGAWWEWSGKVWERRHELVQNRLIWEELQRWEQDGVRPSLPLCKGVLDYVRSFLHVADERMDNLPGLVNLQNGVYDLETGDLRPHDASYLMTTILPFGYEPTAKADLWQMFLQTTLVKPGSLEFDPELADFAQEAIGYSLTTDVSQHVTFWCLGEGANGKGVLFHILEKLGGTAAMALNVGLLRREQYQLAMLAGKRIALCSEASATQNLVDDALIKALIAGDTMSVRQIRERPFDLHPTAKLWWAMNETPPVADTSEGFWRRMRVIPFNRTFGDNERIVDLRDRLVQELPGIFVWAMAGLRRLQERGHFSEPNQVKIVTARYRKESNHVQLFIDDSCVLDPARTVQAGVLYQDYKSWCFDNGFRHHSSKSFKNELERLHIYSRRVSGGVEYQGIAIRII